MRDNWRVALRGSRALLVPYRRRHVPTYHTWMQDTAIQQATASEPLSLDEEHAMQEEWRDDPQKCTFIVLAASDAETSAMALQPPDQYDDSQHMIGDVNLFFGGDHDDPKAAEVEVMIAEAGYRRQGFAREAVTLLLHYGVQSLGVSRYFCKIGEDNAGSLRLFESLGFERCNYAPAFREVELELRPGARALPPCAAMAVVDAPDLAALTPLDNGETQ